MTELPKMFPLRQRFSQPQLDDPVAALGEQWLRARFASSIVPGQTVAIAVGSRGIMHLPELVAELVRQVRIAGGIPSIIPAMGSHGRGTADGQRQVLANLGVTAASVGCEILASMETDLLGQTVDGVPIYFDSAARRMDHLFVLNRVKPHTRFAGSIQSGLLKMLMIGLGKRDGASVYHRASTKIPFDRLIETVIPVLLQQTPLRGGIAVIENGLDQTAWIEAIAPEDLLARERELLQQATMLLPRLPFQTADLLIIDRIGKEISGTGMDTNVIGRKQFDKHAGVDEYPKISQIYVRGLTQETHGNAAGIGLAEYCRTSLVEAIDYEATRINSVTAGHVTAAAIPAHFATDREVLEIASLQGGLRGGEALRWMWIPDTLHLEVVYCSEAFLPQVMGREELEILAQPRSFEFHTDDQLRDVFAPGDDH